MNDKAREEGLCRDALIMANARRLIKAKRITSNGALYMGLFGTGHGTGRAACRAIGLNPDSSETDYREMISFIRGKGAEQ